MWAVLLAFALWILWPPGSARSEESIVRWCGLGTVETVLDDPRGWSQVVRFVQDCESPDVVFTVERELVVDGEQVAVGCYCQEHPARVVYSARMVGTWILKENGLELVTNHEVGHVLGLDHHNLEGVMSVDPLKVTIWPSKTELEKTG